MILPDFSFKGGLLIINDGSTRTECFVAGTTRGTPLRNISLVAKKSLL